MHPFALSLGLLPLLGCQLSPAGLPHNAYPPRTEVRLEERPWWHSLTATPVHFEGHDVILGAGWSKNPLHPSEGILEAKQRAYVRTLRAAEAIKLKDPRPKPILVDLFMTRTQQVFALYRIDLSTRRAPSPLPRLKAPKTLDSTGRYRFGRHRFQGIWHDYMQCEVEGPVLNPDFARAPAPG